MVMYLFTCIKLVLDFGCKVTTVIHTSQSLFMMILRWI